MVEAYLTEVKIDKNPIKHHNMALEFNGNIFEILVMVVHIFQVFTMKGTRATFI